MTGNINPYQWMDDHPLATVILAVAFFAWGFMRRKRTAKTVSRAAQRRSVLDTPLFYWTRSDPFTIRDLLNGGALILGRAGSGKTSSSGRMLMQAIVSNRQSAGLLLAAKPEDADDIKAVFRKARRLDDLIIFDAQGAYRTNFFSCLKTPRDIVTFITTMGEVLQRGEGKGGGDNAQFWQQQQERMLYNAVAALQTAGEPITSANLHAFIMSAATSPEQLQNPGFFQGYHSKILERADKAKKTPIEEHDHKLCFDYWIKEYPGMDSKLRSNILAGVQGTLHVLNTGIVREMVSSDHPNCSPQDVVNGKWWLVNFSPANWGDAGRVISAGSKQVVEQAILDRTATEQSPFCVIWADESHSVVTNNDSYFIAQCRSHKGCLVYLTQSVSSFYAAMKGEAGKHQADALLANYAHTIVHASDSVTAKWAVAKLGRQKEILFSGGNHPGHNNTVWDQVFGQGHASSNYSEHYEQVLQDQEFMVGRTGGPANGFKCDAVVIKSGEPFSSGNSYLRTTFSQRS
jgi:hypothetical protein